ncbi:DUF397 domain-containing protein [Streptomyces sp. KLMMK]|uniref:DUF397 domain-containing protein n=1 Tax=Streptomyces sp. KLMMK TaxID=3109353 RepID=UPI00300B7482
MREDFCTGSRARGLREIHRADGGQTVIYQLAWFKSSYSDDEGDNCVEVADGPRGIHIRDSKQRSGPQLAVGATAWADFLTYIAAA